MALQSNSYKKFVTTAATATLVASALVPAASASVTTAAFTDVPASYTEAVSFLVENNFAVGLSDTKFGISAQITRGDAAVIIASAAGLMDEKAPASGFSDVPNRGAIAVNSLKAAGVINGTSATKFGWDQPIKRGDTAVMFAKAFGLTEGSAADVKFTDVPAKYKEAVAALLANKVANGISATQFGTDNNIKRGDFAKFVYALKDQIKIGVAVQSVTATNGSVVATFNTAPEVAPVSADFVVTRSINGGATTTVTPSNVTYNEATKAVTFAVPEVAQTNAAQTVTYSVKYKDDAAKSASFTVAAAAIPAIQAVADAELNTITLIFNRPVDITTAQNKANYSYDNDVSDSTNLPEFAASAVVKTASTGPYAGNQIVTLTFNDIVADDDAALTISNVKSATGDVIPVTTVELTPVSALGAVPTITAKLTNGAQSSTAINANAGNNVTLDISAKSGVEVASVRYRLQKPDLTYTSWTTVAAEDGRFDETAETAVATINTAGFAGGNYVVQTEVVDAAGRDIYNLNSSTLSIVATDITAPTAVGAGTYSGSTRRVTVEGTATDAMNNVATVQYRVQTYNASTNAYTTSTDWTNASATDGTFNEKSEGYSFSTPQLANSTSYRIQVRSIDSVGNTAVPATVTSVTGTDIVAGPSNAFFTTPASSGDAVDPTLGALAVTVGGTTHTTNARTNKRDVRITATAADNAKVSNVEYAVYLDANNDGSFETEVQAYGSTGVTAIDGGFNSASEAFALEYNLPTTNGEYRILVRSVDAAGNTSAPSAAHDIILDTVVPTVTAVPNTDTPAANDFIFTYSEDVNQTGSFTAPNDVTGPSVYDADNYTVQQASQVIDTNVATSVTRVTDRQFIVTFTSAPTSAQTINVTSVRDLAGNAIAPTSFTISQ